MKRKLLLCLMILVMLMSAVPSWPAQSKRRELPKISDEDFVELCKSGTVRKIQNAIRLRKANVNAKINREFNIEYKDAFHVACAIYAECEYFLTTDIRLQRCYRGGEIIIVNPLGFIQITGEPNQNVQHI